MLVDPACCDYRTRKPDQRAPLYRDESRDQPTLVSALCTMQARKAVLYVRSLTPRAFKPDMPIPEEPSPPVAPPPLPPPACRIISALTPGKPSCATSGTTIKVPVKMALSPAFARSTISARSTTSRLQKKDGQSQHTPTVGQLPSNAARPHDRGMLPVGISFEFSWIRTFCQSENLDCSIASLHPVLFEHVTFGQTEGCGWSVYVGRRVNTVFGRQ